MGLRAPEKAREAQEEHKRAILYLLPIPWLALGSEVALGGVARPFSISHSDFDLRSGVALVHFPTSFPACRTAFHDSTPGPLAVPPAQPPQRPACPRAPNPFRKRNSLNSFRDPLGRNILPNYVR